MENFFTIVHENKKYDTLASIVIYKEYDLLEKQLSYLKGNIDILVVAGNESDIEKIEDIFKKHNDKNLILIKRKKNDGPAGGFYNAQRYAVEKNYSKIIFVESDCFPSSPKIIEDIIKKLDSNDVVFNLDHVEKRRGAWRYTGVRTDFIKNKNIFSCPALFFCQEDIFYIKLLEKYGKFTITKYYVTHRIPIKKSKYAEEIFLLRNPFQTFRNAFIISTLSWKRKSINFLDFTIRVLAYSFSIPFILLFFKKNKNEEAVNQIIEGVKTGIVLEDKISTKSVKGNKETEIKRITKINENVSILKDDNMFTNLKIFYLILKTKNILIEVPFKQPLALICLAISDKLFFKYKNELYILKNSKGFSLPERIFCLFLGSLVAIIIFFMILLFSTFKKFDCYSIYKKETNN